SRSPASSALRLERGSTSPTPTLPAKLRRPAAGADRELIERRLGNDRDPGGIAAWASPLFDVASSSSPVRLLAGPVGSGFMSRHSSVSLATSLPLTPLRSRSAW